MRLYKVHGVISAEFLDAAIPITVILDKKDEIVISVEYKKNNMEGKAKEEIKEIMADLYRKNIDNFLENADIRIIPGSQ